MPIKLVTCLTYLWNDWSNLIENIYPVVLAAAHAIDSELTCTDSILLSIYLSMSALNRNVIRFQGDGLKSQHINLLHNGIVSKLIINFVSSVSVACGISHVLRTEEEVSGLTQNVLIFSRFLVNFNQFHYSFFGTWNFLPAPPALDASKPTRMIGLLSVIQFLGLQQKILNQISRLIELSSFLSRFFVMTKICFCEILGNCDQPEAIGRNAFWQY